MSRPPRLSDQELWQSDGHLSDAALTALADDQTELIPESAARHVDACDACSARLGEHALLSVSIGEALLTAPGAARVSVHVPARLPAVALVLALMLAGIGALPSLFNAPRWLASVPTAVLQGTPVALRATLALFKVVSSGNPSLIVVWMVATGLFAAMGLAIARLAPRKFAWKGVQR